MYISHKLAKLYKKYQNKKDIFSLIMLVFATNIIENILISNGYVIHKPSLHLAIDF